MSARTRGLKQILGSVPGGSQLEQAAISYAEQGIHVLPVRPGDKTPLGRLAPHGHKSASSDPDRVRSWWRTEPDANVAIACARSGLLAIDVDAHRGGDDTLHELERELGVLHAPRSLTPRGGSHTLFRLPRAHVRGGQDALGCGVDVVVNGYIVAPPSEFAHARYEWEFALDEIAIPDLPERWLDRLRIKRRRRKVRPDEPIPEGRRNRTFERMAYTMRSAGLGESAIYAALIATNNECCKPPLTDAEVRAWARTAAKRDVAPPWKIDPIEFANGFELNAIEHRVLLTVSLRANYDGDVVGGDWLAIAARHTPNRVNQALRSLAERDIIAKTGGGGYGRASRYRIVVGHENGRGGPPSSPTTLPPESAFSDPKKPNPDTAASGHGVKTVEVSQPSGLKSRAGGDV